MGIQIREKAHKSRFCDLCVPWWLNPLVDDSRGSIAHPTSLFSAKFLMNSQSLRPTPKIPPSGIIFFVTKFLIPGIRD